MDQLLKSGHRFVVDADLRSYFDTIPHEQLMERVKERVEDAASEEGFEFLGYYFGRGRRWPGKKSLGKLRDAIRSRTPRTSGASLQEIIAGVNRGLRGWFGYFKHSYRTTFTYLDGWVRMRLRSILRKRQKQRGRGRGRDHQRWPNKFFAGLGLYSLKQAQMLASQPAQAVNH